MPISPLVLQRRHAEQGRIRLGHKATGTRQDGSTYTRPAKLDRFRFTSPNRRLIEQIAAIYGGEATPWDNDGKPEFEVFTDATSIPVTVVKGGFSQHMETWAGKRCIHRCDGYTNVLTGEPCDLDEQVKSGRTTINPHDEARPTTRLSVMLADERIEGIGVWRMETHGWNAAAEMPTMADLAMHVGDLVPASLHLVERSAVIDGPKGPQTSRFVVPVLDLHVSKARLVEIFSGLTDAPQIGAGAAPSGVPQLEAAPTDYAALLEAATTRDECAALWKQAGEAGDLDDDLKAAIQTRVQQLDPANDENEVIDPEVVEATIEDDDDGEDDSDLAFTQMLAVAGKAGWETNDVTRAFEAWAALPVDEGSASQFREFTVLLKSGDVEKAVA